MMHVNDSCPDFNSNEMLSLKNVAKYHRVLDRCDASCACELCCEASTTVCANGVQSGPARRSHNVPRKLLAAL